MTRCLRDRELFSLCEGEGTDQQRAHLQTCAACADRHQRLLDDLAVIRRVVREEAPPQVLDPEPRVTWLRWVPAVTVLTAAVLFVWGSMWAWKLAPPSLSGQSPNGEVLQFLGDVSRATLPAIPNLENTSAHISDFAYLRQALGEE